MAPEAELAVYRIVQEALTNAARHAGARHIDVIIELEDKQLSVSVADDGIGLRASGDESAGVRGMRERALAIGGSLAIDSPPGGGGVCVSLSLPLAGDA